MEEIRSLVERSKSGDLDAYGQLVLKFQDMAYGYGYSLLGDFHLAEDAAQEAFIEVYRNLGQLRDPAAFPGWFRRVVFSRCQRILRRKQPVAASLDPACAGRDKEPSARLAKAELKESVLAAIASLPENERTATTLFYINGYSQAEIAGFLEVPVTTVKNRLYTSRKRLKERMMNMVKETLHEHMSSREAIIAQIGTRRLENADVLFVLERQHAVMPTKTLLGPGGAWLVAVTYHNGNNCVWINGSASDMEILLAQLSRERTYDFELRQDQREMFEEAAKARWELSHSGVRFFFAGRASDVAEPSEWKQEIRQLTTADSDIIVAHPDEEVRDYGPRLARGWVRAVGCIHDGKLVAFLALAPYIEGIQDVSYIHTLPNCRRKGTGAELLRFAAKRLLTAAEYLGYSVRSDNEPSLSVCRGAGLHLVATTHCLSAQPRKAKT